MPVVPALWALSVPELEASVARRQAAVFKRRISMAIAGCQVTEVWPRLRERELLDFYSTAHWFVTNKRISGSDDRAEYTGNIMGTDINIMKYMFLCWIWSLTWGTNDNRRSFCLKKNVSMWQTLSVLLSMCSLMLNLHYVFLLRINDHFLCFLPFLFCFPLWMWTLVYKGATIKLQSGLKYLKTSFSIVN